MTDLLTHAPLLIAGPCSAESEEQVFQTAKALQESGLLSVFRAGIWKPRTKPGGFEGVGNIGLPWLSRVQKELHCPVCIEVATRQQLEEALSQGIRIFWIGARTTVNPFYVQELADVVQGMPDVSVWVKNPMHADLQLWEGGLERFQRANIQSVGAIHRGFYPSQPFIDIPKNQNLEKNYRNNPHWSIPIELRRRQPLLPLICDISHIAGRRDLLLPLAQEALDLNFDGWMIETHPKPDEAWSDAAQQITPQQLIELLAKIQIRKIKMLENQMSPIEVLRQEIDLYDQKMIQAIVQRMQAVLKIAQYKKENNIKILQTDRWERVVANYLTMIQETQISPAFVLQLVEAIHEESIRIQNQTMNQED